MENLGASFVAQLVKIYLQAGDLGSIPGSGRSPEGKGYPLQYSGLENSMDCIELDTTERLSHSLTADFWIL